ncbi:hypothetical protein SpCBS45565_g08196 [Spizellomyces sp. 'palustris']|nr:hypothetical protein SpCBS45565_g08196 [Spizellomyces sp. 'palustris']
MQDVSLPDVDSILISAPGKVILFGEHAVVYGKSAVAASLGLRTYAWMRPTGDHTVTLRLPDICSSAIQWDLTALSDFVTSHNVVPTCEPTSLTDDKEAAAQPLLKSIATVPGARQAALAFLHLYTSLFKDPQGIEVCVRSALPVGAGLGSSASYSVCIAAGLLALNGYIKMPKKSKTSYGATELKLVNDWAFVSEQVIHGNPSGVDNAVSTYGGAMLYTNGKMEQLNGFKSIQFILTDTCVPKNTKAQVENVRIRKVQFGPVLDPLMDAMQGISNTCKHLFGALEQSDITQSDVLTGMEELVDMNHCILAACGVSHPSLERIRQLTAKYGLRSKLTGAGGGGYTAIDLIEKVKSELRAESFRCFETSVGGHGVRWASLPLDSKDWMDHWKHFVENRNVDWNILSNT